MDREFDIVVWGATGFTGRLVARYLAEQYGIGGEVRWTIGGRNESKLKSLQTELAEINPAAGELSLIVADSHSPEQLQSMAARTRVVLTTVGPYAKYGSDLVAACVRAQTDYADLCGETQFIRRMIDAHHDAARQSGCRIVHCCGFDSIPSDMGVLVLQQAAQEQFGHPLSHATLYVEVMKGGASGGTMASMLNVLEEARDPAVRRILGDPYALIPSDAERGPDRGDQNGVRWDPERRIWTAPFVMAAINTRVVRRSNAVMDHLWGRDFSYREVTAMKPGLGGWIKSQQTAIGLGAFVTLAWPRITRKLLQSTVLPSPGEGPTPQQQENGFFRLRICGRGNGNALDVVVRGQRDPGYGATSRMLAESALCLARNRNELPDRCGILTPASGIGWPLIQRLKTADVTFEVNNSTGKVS